ncbi:hypothetical protein E8E95_14680 [Pseudomonas sp. BN414]|uniref:hypothetical protein n=1 Tax=Pseudomonas sp. BN414 TaxID=2567888 RepID=UPI0024575E00|nr:hypothetical protein [Pseudomonas sp. BN414]MDH4567926.1 hypothetical protein [Pseudomonas sp. BN414]
MFESHSVARMHLGKRSPDTYEWSYLVLPEDLPWFQITWCHRPSGKVMCDDEQRFIGYVPMLLAHVNAEHPEYFVKEVLMVTPSSMNKSAHSKMERLNRIVSYMSGEVSEPEYAYEVASGQRYPLGLDWASLNACEEVFTRQSLRNW